MLFLVLPLKFLINSAPDGNFSVCVLSYNSRGFCKFKQNFCEFLTSENVVGNSLPILCNQENFILKANSYKISNALPRSHLIIKPAVKNNLDRGRPRNGMFIAVPTHFKNIIDDVSPNFWRLQAVILNCSNFRLLLINSYFPVDPRTMNFDESELLETLNHIRNVLNMNEFNHILLTGDINSDFLRNTGHVNVVKQFIEEYSFQPSWNKFDIDFTNHHDVNGVTFTSTIDHFFWNQELSNTILDAGVIHHPSNQSDHCPIYCKINTAAIEKDPDIKQNESEPKPSWKKSSESEKNDFIQHLNSILTNIEVNEEVSKCKNVHCKDASHLEATDDLMIAILESIDSAASENLHNVVQRPTKPRSTVPGWTDAVKPFQDNAYFWHQVWQSAGRPLNTQLHFIMKRTRNIYHYNIRKCKNAENSIRRNKLLDACINGNGDVFQEIKKMRKSAPVVASSMDGKKEGLEEHFKEIYSKLYNSVDDKENIQNLLDDVNNRINFTHAHDVHKVTPEIVKEAAKHLKDGKSDPVHVFSSDCIKNGPDMLFKLLSIAIKSFLFHGHVTVYLLLATLVPIIKNKLASINTSKNYRSIAISSLILKILDWIILTLFGHRLGLDELQFAYQQESSTSMCTWAVMETIGYFLRNGSEVFTCQTDMTKAFDLVQHSLLFQKLLQEGLSLIFLRILIVIYTFQYANVRWNGIISSIFSLCNGVRQGAILSGILYCFYVNNIFKILRRKNIGCWMNNNFHGMFGYSDDNWVLAPSLDSLREMMKIVEEYCNDHNLNFSTDPNPSKCKTKCIAFLKKERNLPSIFLCGNPLPWVREGIHLGNNFSNKYDGMLRDIKIKRAEYISKNCELQQEFMFAHPKTRFKSNLIFNSHFTGSPTWDLFSEDAIRLENSWNVSVRLTYDLPLQTHRYLVEPVSEQIHLKKMLIRRFLSFINQINKSKKNIPKQLLNSIQYDTRSVTGSNIHRILLLTGKENINQISDTDIENINYADISDENQWRVNLIKEITDVKFDQLSIDGFSREECEEMLQYACIT